MIERISGRPSRLFSALALLAASAAATCVGQTVCPPSSPATLQADAIISDRPTVSPAPAPRAESPSELEAALFPPDEAPSPIASEPLAEPMPEPDPPSVLNTPAEPAPILGSDPDIAEPELPEARPPTQSFDADGLDAFDSDQPSPYDLSPEPQSPDPAPPATQPNRVSATPALSQPSSPSLGGGFNVRLARAPHMLGDFFGNAFAPAHGYGYGTSYGNVFIGSAVYDTDVPGDFLLIDTSFERGDEFLFATSGASFGPVTMPPSTVVTGLTSPGHPGTYTAIDVDEPIQVYDGTDSNNNGFLEMSELSVVVPNGELYEIFQEMAVVLPMAGPGDLIGRTRLNDNNSAMPMDRVYFDYNYFHNAALLPGGVNVNRFSPGFEKTFLDGSASIEVRVPMGITLSSDLVAGASPDVSQYEFGNVVIAPKFLLSIDQDMAVAAGMGVAIPTADDITLSTFNGMSALQIDNDVVHVLPYFALLYQPRGYTCFAHAFVTYDFAMSGNGVYANVDGSGLEHIGDWNDQNLVSLNLSFGSWLYESCCPRDRLQGVAWTTELHYTASMNDADQVVGGTYVVGNPYADLDVINGTIGGHVRIGQTTLTTGYTTPLASGERVFDGEFRFFANRRF